MKRPLLLVLTSALVCGTAAAQFGDSLRADRDNTLYEEGAASNGAGTRMFTGFRFGGSLRRAVVRFDVAGALPPGARILIAELEVTVVQAISGLHVQNLHRATSDWGEGTSFGSSGQGGGASPTPGDTTWTERMFPGVLWNTPGGDFVATSSSTVAAGGNGSYLFPTSAAMVADVQGWFDDPTTNFGWFLIGDENIAQGGTSAKAFATHEDSARGPRLLVTYEIAAGADAYGTSCATPAPPLALAAQGLPTIGASAFGLSIAGGPASASRRDCLFARAPAINPVPVLGCELWLDPASLLPVCLPFGAGGTLGIGIPNDPLLEGQEYFVQGIALDLGNASVVLSNAIALRVGR